MGTYYEPHPFPRFRDYAPSIAIPSVYWDVESAEQRVRAICEILGRVVSYADEMGIEVTRISELLAEIEAGHLDPMIEAAIAEWFDENKPDIVNDIDLLKRSLPLGGETGFDPAYTVYDAISELITEDTRLATILSHKIVMVEDYGAVGNGITDCTTAIQNAINKNPNTEIYFKGGIYCISNTIFVDADVNGVNLNLNGSIVKWTGADCSNWAESTTSWQIYDGHDGISSYPYVMFAVERRETESDQSGNQSIISNGTIDANFKAGICIQSVGYVATFESLRLNNFQYAGILIGTLDDATYNNGVKVSDSPISSQNRIVNCYFTRSGDMAARENVSAIMLTYPDNNIVNCITNRTRYGITLRNGGNAISNTHTTIQYASLPAIADYTGANVRIWPFSAGTTQLNVFTNCYFNGGKYVIYTYHDTTQQFTGANIRTVLSNCHYTFYSSNSWGELFEPTWFGGMWYGIISLTQCSMLYSDYTRMTVTNPIPTPSLRPAIANEISFTKMTFPHANGYLFDASNYQGGEWVPFSNSANPIPANQYKRIAAIVTRNPTAGRFIPGAIDYEISFGNGGFAGHGKIIRNTDATDYVSNHVNDIGTTTMKMYISNDEQTAVIDGVTYHLAYIYVMTPSNITEIRNIKIIAESPLADVYIYAEPYNNSSSTSPNQSVFGTVNNITEIF